MEALQILLTKENESEGTDEDEALEEIVRELPKNFFQGPFKNEFHLFRKYFKSIKKNRYILHLIEDVHKKRPVCELSPHTKKYEFSDDISLPASFTHIAAGENESLANASKKIAMNYTPEKGRHVLASRHIKQGDVLTVEKATVFINRPNCTCKNLANFRCHHCAKIIFTFVRCDRCAMCVFCDTTCRDLAWNAYHQWECYGLQRHFWNKIDEQLSHSAFRVLCAHASSKKLFLEHSPPNFQLGKVRTGRYDTIENVYEEINALFYDLSKVDNEKLNSILHAAARTLVYLIEKTAFFNTFAPFYIQTYNLKLYDVYLYVGGLLVRHSCQVLCNNILAPMQNSYTTVGCEKVEYFAPTILLTASLFNHSCSPNAAYLFENDTIIIKALTEIDKDEEITMSYFPIRMRTTKFNRVVMCAGYLFICECDSCKNPSKQFEFLNTYCCERCGGRCLQNGELLSCLDCRNTFPHHIVLSRLELAEAAERLYQQTGLIQHKLKAYTYFEKVYFKYSTFLFCKLTELYKELMMCGRQADACKRGLHAINVVEQHYKTISVELACFITRVLDDLSSHENFSKMVLNESDAYVLTELAKKAVKARKMLNFFYSPNQTTYLLEMEKKFRNYVKVKCC